MYVVVMINRLDKSHSTERKFNPMFKRDKYLNQLIARKNNHLVKVITRKIKSSTKTKILKLILLPIKEAKPITFR